jgi:hypothetical protein
VLRELGERTAQLVDPRENRIRLALGGGKAAGSGGARRGNAAVPGLLGERQGRQDSADREREQDDPHDASPTPVVHGELLSRAWSDSTSPENTSPGGRDDPTAGTREGETFRQSAS